MKSKRVAKLLACVLAVSMSAVPVYATGTETTKTLNSDVDYVTPTMKVKVPTAMNVHIQAFYDATKTDKVSGCGLTSDEFVIQNTTSHNGVGVALLCTAKVTVNKKADDVQLDYDSNFTPRAGSSKKKAVMQLKAANGTINLKDNTYNGDSTVVTTCGSRLDIKVPAPTTDTGKAPLTTSGNGAFAILGQANTDADWKTGDLGVSITYNLKPIDSSRSVTNTNPINGVTLTSANMATQNVTIVDDTVLTGAVMNEAKVTGVQFHALENDFKDIVVLADNPQLKITYTADTTTPGTEKAKIEFVKESNICKLLCTTYKDKTVYATVALNDGRRFVGKVTVN